MDASAWAAAVRALLMGLALAAAVVAGRAGLRRAVLLLPWMLGVSAAFWWSLHVMAQTFAPDAPVLRHAPDPEAAQQLLQLSAQLMHRLRLEAVTTIGTATLLGVAGLAAWAELRRPGLPFTAAVLHRPDVRRLSWRGPFYAIGITAFAVLWFWVLQHWYASESYLGTKAPELMIALGAAPIGEEIAFRVGLQGVLAYAADRCRVSVAFAVLGSACAWTILHAGRSDPEWVKLAQVFPMGLALGWLQLEAGAECCMLAHAGFNAWVLLVWPQLLPS